MIGSMVMTIAPVTKRITRLVSAVRGEPGISRGLIFPDRHSSLITSTNSASFLACQGHVERVKLLGLGLTADMQQNGTKGILAAAISAVVAATVRRTTIPLTTRTVYRSCCQIMGQVARGRTGFLAWISRTVLGQVKKGIVSDLTFRTYGGHQPVAPHFLCLYGLDSTQEPPETEVCALDLTRRDIPMAPSEPAIVPIQLTPAPTPSSVASPVSSQYEFSYSENSIIGNLGSKMSFVGLFMLGIGLFFFASVIMGWVQSQHLEVRLLFLSLLFIVVGIWTHRAGREFRNVAQTHGKDISHLMGALENLLKLYTLLYLLFFIALVFAIIQLGAHGLYGA